MAWNLCVAQYIQLNIDFPDLFWVEWTCHSGRRLGLHIVSPQKQVKPRECEFQMKENIRKIKLPPFIYPLLEQEDLKIYDYLSKIIWLSVSYTEKQTCHLFSNKTLSLKWFWYVSVQFKLFLVLRMFWWLSDNIMLTWIFILSHARL